MLFWRHVTNRDWTMFWIFDILCAADKTNAQWTKVTVVYHVLKKIFTLKVAPICPIYKLLKPRDSCSHIVVNWSVFAGKESQRDWNEQEVGYIYDAGTGILLIRASQFLSTIAWFFVRPVTRKWASREIWKATFEWFTASGYTVPGCHTWTYLCQLNLDIFR